MGANDQGLTQSKDRYHVIPRTLIFITDGDDVLLIKGASTKRVWPNLYNGIGGHVERKETIREAALREISEETGLNHVENLRLCGVITIDVSDPKTGILLFVFTAASQSRNVKPSSEGELEWINRDNLPLEMLTEDLPILLPRVLAAEDGDPPFFARYHYDESDQLHISFPTEEHP